MPKEVWQKPPIDKEWRTNVRANQAIESIVLDGTDERQSHATDSRLLLCVMSPFIAEAANGLYTQLKEQKIA